MINRTTKRRYMTPVRIPATALILTLLCASFSQGLTKNTDPKEEVIYGNLDQNGQVKDIYVVNAFALSETKAITDYGDYDNLRNMSTTDKLTISDGLVLIKAGQGKFYYQGHLKTRKLPWSIEIKYTLDALPIMPEKLSGKDGRLTIAIDIKQNRAMDPDFFENFALQISLKMDGDKCRDITAEGATIASSGADKVITYILLPGKEKQISLSSMVTDFSMEGIQFNGIPLALMIEAPDTTEMTDGLIELKDGIIKLDDGTKELFDGTAELNDGALELKDGAVDLDDGVHKLKDAIREFVDGIDELNDGVIELSEGAEDLAEGSFDLRSGLSTLSGQSDALSSGAGQAAEAVSTAAIGIQTLSSSTDTIVAGAGELVTNSAIFHSGLDGLHSGMDSLSDGIAGLDNGLSGADAAAEAAASSLAGSSDPAIQALIEGYTLKNAEVEGAKTALGQLKPAASQLADSAHTLATGYGAFDQALQNLESGLVRQQEAIELLSAGLTQLNAQFGTLSTGILQYTGGVKSAYAGYRILHSGISDLADATIELKDGTEELYDGSKELLDGANDLYDGTGDLVEGTKELYDGTSDLREGVVDMQDGTAEMKDKTSTIDTDVQDEINKMIDEYKNEGFVPKSFVSPNNTNVLAVQFVLQTDKIEASDAADSTGPATAEQTLWQRIQAVLGMIIDAIQSIFVILVSFL